MESLLTYASTSIPCAHGCAAAKCCIKLSISIMGDMLLSVIVQATSSCFVLASLSAVHQLGRMKLSDVPHAICCAGLP